ncbi:heavy metal-associated domain-containing protein [Aurantimonas sp. A2-1-M11]|uniref:heavy-metal-associated domain-containing protein n=1 Tax=Aurantimonas sp. A2-1-M11 TaxID=3113712 RepID=UPI002F955DFA
METTIETHGQTVLNIPGMHCGGCARTIEKALGQVAGVAAARADAGPGIAEVVGSACSADLVAAVAAAGYEASVAVSAPEVVDRQAVTSKCCCS